MRSVSELLILFCATTLTQCAPVTVSFYGINEKGHREEADKFAVNSAFAHITTKSINLRLNSKAHEKLGFLRNVSLAGISMSGLVPVHERTAMKKAVLKDLDTFLTKPSISLLEALVDDQQAIPIELVPSDESFHQTMNFIHAFDYLNKVMDDACLMQVSHFDPLEIPENQRTVINNLTRGSSKPKPRSLPITVQNPFQISEEYLKEMLSGILSEERNHGTSLLVKKSVASYIAKKFHEFGMLVISQEFELMEFDSEHPPNGTNIIGVLPGTRWGTSTDAPVIVGAHYDTVLGSPGLIDNASGTASVLEVARVLSRSDCIFENSIYFVAFDLEETGVKGSTSFVKDLLLRVIFPAYGIGQISGALILDCVGAWNPNNDTQTVPSGWSDIMPTITQEIGTEKRGDFVGIYHRQQPDEIIVDKFDFYYNGLGKDHFRLQRIGSPELTATRPPTEVIMRNFEFMRSDHTSFWYPLEDYPSISFPAILISDTGPFRGDMKECYHAPCDTAANITVNTEFMTKIAETVAWTIADLAKGLCDFDKLHGISDIFILNSKD